MNLDIRKLDRADEAQLWDWWSTGHAATADRPVDFWPDWEISRRSLPQVDPESVVVLLGGYEGGTIVASALAGMPLLDNAHVAQIDVWVHPDHRRRGVGSTLLERTEAEARADDHRTLLSQVSVPLTEENDAARWARARGYEVANVDGIKAVDLAEHEHRLPELASRAAEKVGDYRLAWWQDPAPREHLASLAAAMSRFLEEIPLGDLDLNPQAFTPERLRAREARRAAQARQQLTVVALAPDGTVAGYTNLTLSPHAPRMAAIGDTLVLPDHRGHRLGLAAKVLLHQKVRELHPGVEFIATGNATSNQWMNDVNEQLGYRLVDRSLELQKTG